MAVHHLRDRGEGVLDDDAADSLSGWIQVATQCGHHEVILDLMQRGERINVLANDIGKIKSFIDERVAA